MAVNSFLMAEASFALFLNMDAANARGGSAVAITADWRVRFI